MLVLKDISKTYHTEQLTQQALDRVSVTLREQEFVAILGPSGSGKTTLLNIIGGLDRYDSGDLIINGTSTRKYKDKDWDTYRNHTIGFVFQNYNLIGHQTVLANVELALTIGGVPNSEKRSRAVKALEEVGLGEHIHKKPGQLSGGQMQRVAIARALVNDPDIILADEPTGALDSETSLQVMEILKKVSENRLVVMVTHNKELADVYATRIITIRDGKILADTDPCGVSDLSADADLSLSSGTVSSNPAASSGQKKRASMSFLTALSLSFSNLRNKRGRTILVALAGSIGIIGIAMIMAISNGASEYVHKVEEETIMQYPVEILSTGFDFTSFMNILRQQNNPESAEDTDLIQENPMVRQYSSGLSKNDLRSFKAYLDSGESGAQEYARAIEYDYGIDPRLFKEINGKIRRVHPDESLDIIGLQNSDLNMMKMATFLKLPENDFLYLPQYEVMSGHWPENRNECVVVLGPGNTITDSALYAMGLKDPEELDEISRSLLTRTGTATDYEPTTWKSEDFIGITFRVIPGDELVSYDEDLELWVETTSEAQIRTLYENAEPLTVTGVVRLKEDSTEETLECGIYYPTELVIYLMEQSQDSPAAAAQLADPSVNIFTGRPFGEQSDASEIDLAELFSMDEEVLQDAFSIDLEDLLAEGGSDQALNPELFDFSSLSDLNLADYMDLSSLAGSMNLSETDLSGLMNKVKIDFSADRIRQLLADLTEEFKKHADELKWIPPEKILQVLGEYLRSDEVRDKLNALVAGIVERTVAELPACTPADEPGTADAAAPQYANTVSVGGEGSTDAGTGTGENPSGDASGGEPSCASSCRLIDPDELIANLRITAEELAAFAADVSRGFLAYAKDSLQPDIDAFLQSFSDFLNGSDARAILMQFAASSIDISGLQDTLMRETTAAMTGVAEEITTQLTNAMSSVLPIMAEQIAEQVNTRMKDMAAELQEILTIDPQMFADAVHMNLTEEQLLDWISSLVSGTTDTLTKNLDKIGYADPEDPSQITIYPKDFDSKTALNKIIEDYNEAMQEAGETEKILAYTDFAGTMLSSVSTIINAVTTTLIALVAISLVVSSIMIGVITNISVLERRKEIGILRALGASKRNIAHVFNAETFITGLLSGLIGVGTCLLLLIPANWILHEFIGQPNLNGYLAPLSAVFLILMSILLDVISGLIPASKASRSDPVLALRGE